MTQSVILSCRPLLGQHFRTAQSELPINHNINGRLFLRLPLLLFTLLSRKWHIIGFFIPKVSRSESFSLENLCPSRAFLWQCVTMRSSIPMWRRKVDISSTENSCKLPSDGISISVSGINFSFAENRIRKIIYKGQLLNPASSRQVQLMNTFGISV